MSKPIFCIDIGGTAVKLGLVDDKGAVVAHAEQSVSFDGYRTPILDTVLRAAETFLSHQQAVPADLTGIGVSATGQIDCRRGVVVGTGGNLPGWLDAPIAQRLREAFGLPVTVANDANCMCLGETWAGAAVGYTDVIGVTLGTGVGGGVLTGGRLLEGARGLGGELGHMMLHARDGIACGCGQRGCWERYASVTALVGRARALDASLTDGRRIFQAAAEQREDVLALLDDWMSEIAAGLIGLTHLFNPQVILIGGGVSGQQKLLIEPLRDKIRAGVMPAFAKGLEVRAAQLQNHAGLVGAAYYFLLHR